jgi:hypothetical protein
MISPRITRKTESELGETLGILVADSRKTRVQSLDPQILDEEVNYSNFLYPITLSELFSIEQKCTSFTQDIIVNFTSLRWFSYV